MWAIHRHWGGVWKCGPFIDIGEEYGMWVIHRYARFVFYAFGNDLKES